MAIHMDLAATRLRMPAVVKALRFHSLENSASRSLFEASQQAKSLSLFCESSVSVIDDKPLRAEAMCYLLCRGIYRYQHLEQRHSDTSIFNSKFQLIDSDKFELKNTTLDFSEQRSLDNGLLWKSWWTIRPPVRQIWTPTLTDSSPVSASNESNVWLNDVESVPKAKSS